MNKWRTISFACVPGIIGFAAYALSRPHGHSDENIVRARSALHLLRAARCGHGPPELLQPRLLFAARPAWAASAEQTRRAALWARPA
jgi:hypothetical protein